MLFINFWIFFLHNPLHKFPLGFHVGFYLWIGLSFLTVRHTLNLSLKIRAHTRIDVIIEIWYIWSWSNGADLWFLHSIWGHNRIHLNLLIKVSFFIYSVAIFRIVTNHSRVRIRWLRSNILTKLNWNLIWTILLSHLRCHLWCWWWNWHTVLVSRVRLFVRFMGSSWLNFRNQHVLRIDCTSAAFCGYLLELRYSILILS